MKLAIIGSGKMGQAIAKGVIAGRLVTESEITLFYRCSEKYPTTEPLINCNHVSGPSERAKEADVVLLAVKPQDFRAACDLYGSSLSSTQIVVSIMAGVTLSTIKSLLPQCTQLVRAMPNLHVTVRAGITPYFNSLFITPKEAKVVEGIFRTTGHTVLLPSESLMDAAAAVSGSGPAYFFHLLESLMAGAETLGFSPAVAFQLVHETFLGSAALWKAEFEVAGTISPVAMMERVCSKKGTTDAALTSLGQSGVKESYRIALEAALNRGRELESSAKR